MKELTTEQKYEIQIEVSNVLNEQGVYSMLEYIFKKHTGKEFDNNSECFHDIEEFIVDSVLREGLI